MITDKSIDNISYLFYHFPLSEMYSYLVQSLLENPFASKQWQPKINVMMTINIKVKSVSIMI